MTSPMVGTARMLLRCCRAVDPRVQPSVFGCEFGIRREVGQRARQAPVEDQVRLYPPDDRAGPLGAVAGADDRGTPGFLDHYMSWYTGRSKRLFPASVSATESAGHGLGSAWVAENGQVSGLAWRGQRNGHQTRRSRAPPEGIRRNAQPDTEGIETWRRAPRWIPVRRSQCPARYRGHRNDRVVAFSCG